MLDGIVFIWKSERLTGICGGMFMENKQVTVAMQNMIGWLSDEHELGKAPTKIECVGKFDYNDMHYYIFKYKATMFGKWLVGVCGGFENDGLEPCGHTFSDKQPYNKETAQSDCIAMIEMIMAYWKEQARKRSE